MNKRNIKDLIVGIMLITLLIFTVFMVTSMGEEKEEYKYSEILSYFNTDKVEWYEMDFNSGELKFKLKDDPKERKYVVPSINIFIEDVHKYVIEKSRENPDDAIALNYKPQIVIPSWLSWIPIILIMGAMLFLLYNIMSNSGAGKAMNFGKVKSKQNLTDKKQKTFEDVAGADEEKEELQEIVDFLRSKNRFIELGARIPKGVLLMGPPGTGKTLLAKAVAGEAGVPFYSISGSDFVEMYVGVGASRVRDLFDQAKKDAPSIIFIDEIDAVGRHRGAGLGGGHDEREQTLNQLLVEMDGFDENSGVIVIAATNRNDILDPALLRPGRFDRQIVVNYPDVKGREQILKVHARNKPLSPDVHLDVIAKSTAGFTGADLENLLNEAALLAARARKKSITQKEIEEATVKVLVGPEKKSRVISDKEKKETAYHEAGHAITSYYLETQDPVHQVSIIPRGLAGGYTMNLPEKDRTYGFKKQMHDKIVVLLGGRVSEKLVLDDISTGASNDIERATKMARDMIMRYGFSEKLGTVLYGQDNDEVFLGRSFNQTRNYSENVAAEIDSEIREILDTNFERAMEILTEHIDKLHELSEYLFEFEKIDGDEFKRFMESEFTIEMKREEVEKQREKDEKRRILVEELEKARQNHSQQQEDDPDTEELEDIQTTDETEK